MFQPFVGVVFALTAIMFALVENETASVVLAAVMALECELIAYSFDQLPLFMRCLTCVAGLLFIGVAIMGVRSRYAVSSSLSD